MEKELVIKEGDNFHWDGKSRGKKFEGGWIESDLFVDTKEGYDKERSLRGHLPEALDLGLCFTTRWLET